MAFVKDGYPILECAKCRHRFCIDIEPESHVGATYNDNYFCGGGAGYDDYDLEAGLLKSRGNRYGRLLAEYQSPGRLLDVGAASGHIAAGLVSAGWDVSGLEPNETMAKRACENGIPTTVGTFEDYRTDSRFDAITLIQVMAHFVDPKQVADQARRLLRPNGLCLIETWDRHSLTASLFGKHWHEYSPPSVLHWFGRQSLRNLMCASGFEFVTWGRTLKWIGIGHARSLVAHKLGNGLVGRLFSTHIRMVSTAPSLTLSQRRFVLDDLPDRKFDSIQLTPRTDTPCIAVIGFEFETTGHPPQCAALPSEPGSISSTMRRADRVMRNSHQALA